MLPHYSSTVRLFIETPSGGTRSDLINTVALARWPSPIELFLEPFPTVSPDPPAKQKPLETVPCQFRFTGHRAEATGRVDRVLSGCGWQAPSPNCRPVPHRTGQADFPASGSSAPIRVRQAAKRTHVVHDLG